MLRLALMLSSPRHRRSCAIRSLAAAALLPVVLAIAQPVVLAPTPSQPEGPFYPKTFPADRDSDLTQVAGRMARAQGTPLYLSGRALTRDGRALGSATVELWQCDVHGRYHHAGDDGVPRDDNFQGYGIATTDAGGRYAFKTIRPVPYGGRPPHLHIRLRAGGGAVLTTQIYVAGDALAGDSVLSGSSSATIRQLTMALTPTAGREQGALSGTFDLVLR
ncbi:MAG: intradiol ring-cleavage dioxygenase [Betaproteobacteria bacterium]|nr:intradiol ring-cleavage dioxygenase [Betaproteobacteria bacterium]